MEAVLLPLILERVLLLESRTASWSDLLQAGFWPCTTVLLRRCRAQVPPGSEVTVKPVVHKNIRPNTMVAVVKQIEIEVGWRQTD